MINKLKWRLLRTLRYCQHLFPTTAQQQAIRILKEQANATPIEATSHKEWQHFQETLKNYIATKNPLNFLQWDVIRTTMFYGGIEETELLRLKNSNHSALYQEVMIEDSLGNPTPHYWQTNTSANLVHHLYSLDILQQHTSIQWNNIKTAIEFGGGYGSFCRLVYRLGFKGKYTIYDLPLFSCLQNFYLSLLKEKFDIQIGAFDPNKQINLIQ